MEGLVSVLFLSCVILFGSGETAESGRLLEFQGTGR